MNRNAIKISHNLIFYNLYKSYKTGIMIGFNSDSSKVCVQLDDKSKDEVFVKYVFQRETNQ